MIRGSTEWLAAPGSVLLMKRLDARTSQIIHLKLRDGQEVPSFLVRLDTDGERLRLVWAGEADLAVPGLVTAREAVLRSVGGEMAPIADVIDGLKGTYSEKQIRSTVYGLIREGVLEKIPVGRRVFLSLRVEHAPSTLDGDQGAANA